jgi:hypothetical protein
MPIEEQEIMWILLSLSMLKVLKYERVQLTRSVKSTDDPQVITDHENCFSLQYDILEEIFKRMPRYLETHGTAKTLAIHTLREIVSTLVCQSCGEI